MSFHYRKAMRHERISQRAAGYGFPGFTVDGNDVLAAFKSAGEARSHVSQNGPVLMECVTYRWRGHSKSDANRYRTREEIEAWKSRCPIERFRLRLLEAGVLTESEAEEIALSVVREVDHAVQVAQQADEAAPIAVPDEVYA